MKKTKFAALIALALCSSMLFVQGCGEVERFTRRIGLLPPPVSVTFRESLLSGYVLQLHNQSGERIVARVNAVNEGLKQSMNHSVGIAPYSVEEIGVLETGWMFQPGESGSVKIDGYGRELHFDIGSGGYNVR